MMNPILRMRHFAHSLVCIGWTLNFSLHSTAMEAPGLKTRTKNKHVRPGVAAGVDKKTRRTKDQMARARDDESTAKAQAALDEKKKLKRLAALEDQQHRDDITYAATANHPPDKPAKANIPAVVDSGNAYSHNE
jgi:hypothetical protein